MILDEGSGGGGHPWEVSLPEFEGPLDLLLSLIRRHQYDIRNLPVADITRQYLQYLEQAGRLDVDLSADFAYMAATLIQIKSRSLLPQDPELAAREPDREKEQLIRQLLDRQQVRNGAEFLKGRLEIAGVTFTRGATGWEEGDENVSEHPASPGGSLNLLDIVRLAKQALDSARAVESLDLRDSGPTVEEMVAYLVDELPLWGSVSLEELMAGQGESRERQGVLFLALLELARGSRVRLDQESPFGELRVSTIEYGTTVP